MVDLWVLLQLSGYGGFALVVLAALGAVLWLVMIGLTIARWRVPAPLWWAPPLIALAVAAGFGFVAAQPATGWLADAATSEIPQVAMAAEAQHLAPRALGFFWLAVWCGLSAVVTATAAVMRLEHPQSTWLSGSLPIASGMYLIHVESDEGDQIIKFGVIKKEPLLNTF